MRKRDQDRAWRLPNDRSGVAYQEYHGVYGEDVEAALRFLFAAMAPKPDTDFPLQGRPRMLYMDNGPIARSGVFQHVLRYLDIELRTHLPRSQAPRHATARAKGKVERPFRTVKEMHETLYHFHEPETEQEANAWLRHFLRRYNQMPHRTADHSRLDDWLEHFPPEGLRAMCEWERFCTFAREPERRKVANDARIAVDGVLYQVDPNLVGETVILWWGLFDQELYVEHGPQRYGPYHPVGGPIPLHRYRRFKKTAAEQRAERLEALAAQLVLPRSALTGLPEEPRRPGLPSPPLQPFVDPDPFQEIAYPTPVAAKLAIADYLAMPLAKLSTEQRMAIEDLLRQTLRKQDILTYIRTTLQPMLRRLPPMLPEVMAYHGIRRDFRQAGFFETAQYPPLYLALKTAITQGHLVAVAGVVGCGKTTLLQRVQAELLREKEILVARSLAVEKDRVNLGALIMALFYDLATEKDIKIPPQPEKRERQLLDLISKRRKPIALFIDEAHDLRRNTLTELKRLMELVRQQGDLFAVVLAGHPRLKNLLRHPAMEEIGARATVLTFDGIQGQQRDYLTWLLETCVEPEHDAILTPAAVERLAEALATPLQMEQYLTLVLEEAYRAGQTPVTPDLIDTVLARGLNDLEPTLARYGYSARAVADLLHVRPAEVHALLRGRLPTGRAQELQHELRAVGIPL